jgi:glutathione S-transferase
MRARLALFFSGIKVEIREILLREKPLQMTSLSEKATVPVLVLESNTVIDESIDIMYWALNQNDPTELLHNSFQQQAEQLIKINDEQFKPALDKYKYSVRFPEQSEIQYRNQSINFLNDLDLRLKQNKYLLADKQTIADIAIFPFIRQFAAVDRQWFEETDFNHLKSWLNNHLHSDSFKTIMQKHKVWQDGDQRVMVY